MLPYKIDTSNGEVQWRDFGRYHVYQGRFSKALANHNALSELVSKPSGSVVSTQIDLLSHVKLDCVSPSLFIFHMSRCGSTLLTRVLAQSRSNIVYGEADIINELWASHQSQTNGGIEMQWDRRLAKNFKNLFRVLGRRRLESYQNSIFKFPSLYNSMIDKISELYPTTPVLFIYRNPIEVMSSLEQRPSKIIKYRNKAIGKAVVGQNLPDSDLPVEYASTLLNLSMDSALKAKTKQLYFLDYTKLNKQNLPSILDKLNLKHSSDELLKMQTQFDFYSKNDGKNQHFVSDSLEKVKEASAEARNLCSENLDTLFRALVESDRNITKNG
jgi:hypothetical protein